MEAMTQDDQLDNDGRGGGASRTRCSAILCVPSKCLILARFCGIQEGWTLEEATLWEIQQEPPPPNPTWTKCLCTEYR